MVVSKTFNGSLLPILTDAAIADMVAKFPRNCVKCLPANTASGTRKSRGSNVTAVNVRQACANLRVALPKPRYA